MIFNNFNEGANKLKRYLQRTRERENANCTLHIVVVLKIGANN